MTLIVALLVASRFLAANTIRQPATAEVMELQGIALRRADGEFLLMRIRSMSAVAMMVCVRSTSYQVGGTGAGGGMPHGCQSDANFDVILPGESIFRRTIDATVGGGPPDAAVAVSATVVTTSPSEENKRTANLSWNGTLRQARDAARLILKK